MIYFLSYQLIGRITAPPPVATTNRLMEDKSLRTSLYIGVGKIIRLFPVMGSKMQASSLKT